MKKIICLGMAVAMMAALAIPASAAGDDAGATTQATNTTKVHFMYKSNENEIDAENEDGVYTITIPAHIDLKVKDENDKTGITFEGSGTVALSGVIGQESTVTLNVQSSNGYQLKGGSSTIVDYKMTAATNGSDGKEITDGSNGITMTTKVFTSTTPGSTDTQMSKLVAKSFKNEQTIDLSFENEGATGIFGKCDLDDTLTFSYKYDGTAGNAENTFAVEDGSVDCTFPEPPAAKS